MQLNVNPNATTPPAASVNVLALDPAFIANDSLYRFNNASNAFAASNPSAIYVPTAKQISTMEAVSAVDRAAFQNLNLSTKRTRTDGGFGLEIDEHWGVGLVARQEYKKGLRPISTVSRNTGGDIAMVIPDLIDTRTDQFDMNVNYRDANSFFSATYYVSNFNNNVQSMSWQNWATADHTVNQMSSAPDNQFQQLSLTGGYDLAGSTKLVVSAAYGRNTQDDPYMSIGTELGSGVPQAALGGVVVSRSFSAKVNNKTTKDLTLMAAYKYDDRDNQTPVNTYVYYDAGETKADTSVFNGANLGWTPTGGALGIAANINANRPYSKRSNQVNMDADYRFSSGQAIKLGLDLQKIDRYCNGTWIDCVDADSSTEKTLRGELRSVFTEDLNAKVGYAYSVRTIDNYNPNAFLALVPMADQIASSAAAAGVTISAYQAMVALGLTGNGVWAGYPTAAQIAAMTPAQRYYFAGNNALAQSLYGNVNRISELAAMRRFNMADRDRSKVRSSLDWQASERLSFQAGVDYNDDNFANSQYGLNSAQSAAINLDASLAASENTTMGVFLSSEEQRSKNSGNSLATNNAGTGSSSYVGQATNTAILGNEICGVVNGVNLNTIALRNQNNRTDPCNNWSANMRDRIDTVGLNYRQKGLMSGKFDFSAELLYSSARSDVAVTGGSYVNNPAAVQTMASASTVTGAPAGVTAAFYIPAAAFPTVTSNTVELKLKGKYKIDKVSAVRFAYTYAQTKVVDWSFDTMQIGGGGSGYLPSNELAPDYVVQTLGMSYVYTF